MNDFVIWLERLFQLRRSLLRKAAAEQGLQLVHAEILDYLDKCNQYSNTPLAVSEYLGQTKGSISQSLKVLESKKLIHKKPDKVDGRSARLFLTPQAMQLIRLFQKELPEPNNPSTNAIPMLRSILENWQQQKGLKGFGICGTCRYNSKINKKEFLCELTGETLSIVHAEKICREHLFPIK